MRRRLIKAYPNLEELDSYGIQIASLIDKVYPQWMGFVEVGEFEGDKFLKVNVPPVSNDFEKGMIISSYDHCLTIYLDSAHWHFGRGYNSPKMAFEKAKEFIDSILNEDFIVGVKIGDKYHTTSILTREKILEATSEQVTFTRSWLGTHNRRYDN